LAKHITVLTPKPYQRRSLQRIYDT